MAETKARFLADQISTTDAAQSFTFPTTRGTNNQVLTRDDTAGTGGTAWKGTGIIPTITSIQYSAQTSGTFTENAGQTATDPSGGYLVKIIGTSFDSTLASPADSSNVTISIGGTSATSISVNSSRTEATFTAPAKSAGSHTLTATNSTGQVAQITIAYDLNPAWVTGPNADLGDFVDGSITGTNGPQIIASESGSNLTTGYKQATSNSDNTVITSGIAGLTIGDNGYLTGTLAGTNGATNNFYAVAHDNEGQQSAIRQFHFVSYDFVGNGGDSQSTQGSNRVHKFTTVTTTGTFSLFKTTTVDILVVGGGGGGSSLWYGGGGGGGGFVEYLSQSLSAGNYTIKVGAGGAATVTGGLSQFGTLQYAGGGAAASGTAGGAGANGSYSSASGGNGDNGAGGTASNTGTSVGDVFGNNGGNAAWGSATTANGGGGGGAGGIGGNSSNNANGRGAAGAGKTNNYTDGSTNSTYSKGGRGGDYATGGYGDAVANSGQGGDAEFAGGSGIVIIRYAV